MSSFLKLLSKVDTKTKATVYGWIREAEISLQIAQIPMMLSSICILYYRDEEIFDTIAKHTKLSQNKKCVTKIGADYECNCNYGLTEIASNSDYICRWDLKIIKKSESVRGGIRVGISSIRKSGDFWKICKEITTGIYMYSSWRRKLDPFEDLDNNCWKLYGKRFGENDIVSIILDLKRQQIRYLVNGEDQGIANRNVQKSDEIKYQLLVVMAMSDDCVEIMNFTKY